MVITRHLLPAALTALALSTLLACGRSDPDGALAAADVDALARDACFDKEGELTALLDDDYVPADTVFLDAEDVAAACFDTEAELTALLDDDYLAADFVPDFGDLSGVPADLADGDDDTLYTASSPIAVVGTDISLDATGCVDGDALSFQGGSFGCATPSVQTVGIEGVGAAVANTRPFEAVPILAKLEVSSGALAAPGTTVNVQLYNAANRPPRAFLIVDAWAVGSALTGAPVWHLRDQNAQISADVAAPAAGDIGRVAAFVNQGARNVAVTDSIDVRVTATVAGDNATFTVYVLALPL